MKTQQQFRSSRQAVPVFTGIAFVFSATALALLAGCSVVATRPVQEMSDTAAALRAAREVQADQKATDYFRLSEELFFKARQEYRLKNFSRARKYADQARDAAEKAEFISIRGGAIRSSLHAPTAEAPVPPSPAAPSPDSAAPGMPSPDDGASAPPPTAPTDSPSPSPTP